MLSGSGLYSIRIKYLSEKRKQTFVQYEKSSAPIMVAILFLKVLNLKKIVLSILLKVNATIFY